MVEVGLDLPSFISEVLVLQLCANMPNLITIITTTTIIIIIISFLFPNAKLECRDSHMLNKYSSTELHSPVTFGQLLGFILTCVRAGDAQTKGIFSFV